MSYEDVERLQQLAVFSRTRIPHFMRDQERYLHHLDHIVAVNELDDSALQHLLPWPLPPSPPSAPPESKKKKWRMLVHGLYHYEYHLKQYYRCFIWVISCETWTAKKDVHTNTSIYIFTFVQCMFMWLFHRAKYSSSAPPRPPPFTPTMKLPQ